MALADPYAPCPCGSGKKFKWCCGPIHEEMDKAFRQEEDGQHEAALRTMDEIIAAHPGNPEPHGRKAQMLYSLGRAEEAEAALETAFAADPQYAFGYYLKGRFRMIEGEFRGALLLLRKAAELYPATSGEILADVQTLIAQCEMKLNRPVAARAAVDIALKYDPADADNRQVMEKIFGDQSTLPLCARKAYRYRTAGESAKPETKKAWEGALRQSGKLTDARQGFEKLTAANPEDKNAWYNLGLTLAWLGENAAALRALDEYIRRETDDDEAAAAATLGEVLRCGEGLEQTEADYAEHSRTYQFADGQKVVQAINDLQDRHRLFGVQVRQEDRVLTGTLVEAPTVLVGQQTVSETPRFAAHLIIVGRILRIWGHNRDTLLKTAAEVEQAAQGGLGEYRDSVGPAYLSEILSEAMVLPWKATTDEELRAKVTEGFAKFFEDVWIHRPLRSLSGIPPVDAVGSFQLRKYLLGAIQFLADCAAAHEQDYDFDRLRRKLGLVSGPAPAREAGPDIAAMGAAELAALPADTLSAPQLELAYQTATKLDAQELASAFLRRLVGLPADAARADRFPWFSQLIQAALRAGEQDPALGYVDQGEAFDREHNEGRRADEFEMWRGRVHARRGEVQAAQDVFDRVIARAPGELKYRGTATETMLSARDGGRALHFAQGGLAEARKQQKRDSEQYFLELEAAAKKLA